LDESLPLAIRQSIWLHRKIDAFTDAHPVFRASKGRLRPPWRRYAGILVDVFYDHFLARDWALYSSVSLRDFSWSVYRTLHSHHEGLPTPMNRNGAVLEALFLVTLQETGNPAPPGERQRRPQNVD
jgi:acyl carrier protein phosphodiesterase